MGLTGEDWQVVKKKAIYEWLLAEARWQADVAHEYAEAIVTRANNAVRTAQALRVKAEADLELHMREHEA